ncbi:winged helix-turn-helix domain-containing protein [Flavihumibacter profundi]|uniref:winged helix-turn-helix domain-containing protein n=1 Tax=Flavihumibacter profundi TaxID=2716883 RepID=UPI001CC43931|nr:winged helix-turn-helix domain-containing protein [Flavihumibacter profundi]
MENQVAKDLNLSADQVNEKFKGNTTKLGYRLSWSRYFLKRYGLLESSVRGIYSLFKQLID